ncbi:hypothetical protein TWF970_001614 [Orbilia oligospora]|uniref:Uncharacterized protein n=1 Tax=Orbilia oligospora TaxID=2813651 RepID=A0A7C8VKB9_ORBOL|nr:hypothetical protein TWF970_001614 [Orbilia oligospora]
MTSRHPPPSSSPTSSSPPSSSFTSSSASQTNNNRQHIRDQTVFSQPDLTKKPFTPPSYRSRFTSTSSSPSSSTTSASTSSSPNPNNTSIPKGYSTPKKRRSIFIEQLDSADLDNQPPFSENNVPIASSSSQSPTKNNIRTRSRSGSNSKRRSRTAHTILSINPLGQKDSYMMHLPFEPLRISILILILVSFTTISLSTSASSDLDSLLLKRMVPGGEGVVERREASIAPSFSFGPAVRNPEKDIPKLRTGLLVLVVSLVFAGLMT